MLHKTTGKRRDIAIASPPRRRFVSKKSLAQHFELSLRSVDRLLADGTIRGYRMGPRALRFDLDEVEQTLTQSVVDYGTRREVD